MKKANLTLMKNTGTGHTNFGMLNKIFEFGKIQIRVEVDENGDPWFVANDICKALGLRNPRQAVEHHVYEDDVHQMDTL
jgi:prophage antirepressor-like protein